MTGMSRLAYKLEDAAEEPIEGARYAEVIPPLVESVYEI